MNRELRDDAQGAWTGRENRVEGEEHDAIPEHDPVHSAIDDGGTFDRAVTQSASAEAEVLCRAGEDVAGAGE
jgi:hypothetical protein